MTTGATPLLLHVRSTTQEQKERAEVGVRAEARQGGGVTETKLNKLRKSVVLSINTEMTTLRFFLSFSPL